MLKIEHLLMEDAQILQLFDDLINVCIYGNFYKYKDLSFCELIQKINQMIDVQRSSKRKEVISLLK
jgi:hypothetical protein